MLKSPSLLLSSYGNLFYLYTTHPNPIIPRRYQSGSRRKAPSNDTKFRYDDLGWPKYLNTAIPTPYQIFQQEKKAAYSKVRFYELVKLYHPDHSNRHSLSRSLSPQVRIERYHLVVAANSILSDPAKRMAYDNFGFGWTGNSDSSLFKHGCHPYNKAERSAFNKNSSPMSNATWEDWDNWYHRSDGAKQEPLYFSNGGLFAFIVSVVLLGGIGTATKTEGYSKSFLEKINMVHDDCSKKVQSRRKASHGFGNKDSRVESFLRTRDSCGYGLSASENNFSQDQVSSPVTDDDS